MLGIPVVSLWMTLSPFYPMITRENTPSVINGAYHPEREKANGWCWVRTAHLDEDPRTAFFDRPDVAHQVLRCLSLSPLFSPSANRKSQHWRGVSPAKRLDGLDEAQLYTIPDYPHRSDD